MNAWITSTVNACHIHNNDATWVSRRFKSLATRQFVQQFLKTDIKIHQSFALLTLCEGNPPATSGFPPQGASRPNAEIVPSCINASLKYTFVGCVQSCPFIRQIHGSRVVVFYIQKNTQQNHVCFLGDTLFIPPVLFPHCYSGHIKVTSPAHERYDVYKITGNSLLN